MSGGDAIKPFVAFYDIHGRKREVPFFCAVPDTTQDLYSDVTKYGKLQNDD
jgi:hypothetical protein